MGSRETRPTRARAALIIVTVVTAAACARGTAWAADVDSCAAGGGATYGSPAAVRAAMEAAGVACVGYVENSDGAAGECSAAGPASKQKITVKVYAAGIDDRGSLGTWRLQMALSVKGNEGTDRYRAQGRITDHILLGDDWLIWPFGTDADEEGLLTTLSEQMQGTRCVFAPPK